MTGILQNRTVVITGAGRGIGAAIACAFAREGARLVLAARSGDQLETVARQIRSDGGEAHVVPTDMGDVVQVQALAETALKIFGNIDIVVSNAAHGGAPVAIVDTPLDDWRAIHEINVIGPLTLVQALGPQMTNREGANFLFISSIRGFGGTPFGGAYGGTKAVLNQLTRTLACEWGPRGIRVNAICPGPVNTDMVAGYFAGDTELYEAYGQLAPMAGWTQPDDLAGPAVFLASAAASRVTGMLLVVDGGLSAINHDAFPPLPAAAKAG